MAPPVLLHALASLQAEHEISPSKLPDLLHGMRADNPLMTKPKVNDPAYVHQGFENDRLFVATYDHAGDNTCNMCDTFKVVEHDQRVTTDPNIHYAVIASGNSLIEDAPRTIRLQTVSGRGAFCFEMEAAGLINYFPA
ncbi:hypothetical protein VFPBJ_11151 [Purpureocillium lilacinum]|nr:hypothetical protein VFPBJ_11151 [Purpureocillium lilacinum]